MKRYVVRKYVMANSLVEALKKEKTVVAEDGWIDEKQPESEHNTHVIGFDINGSDYYSPHLKQNKKRKLIKKLKK